MYGIAVGEFGIAPSEARAMTPHEIMAVVSVKIKSGDKQTLGDDDMAELYDDLMEARGECS